MDKKQFVLFSNGTEAEMWMERNCERCIKGVFYNEKTDRYPKYRCAIQKHIEEAWVGDGRGDERTYNAVSHAVCPHIKTEWQKRKKTRKEKLTLNLF